MDKKTAILVMRQEGNSLKKISESLNVCINTIRKVLRADKVEYTPHKYKRNKTNYPKLDGYISTLESMISEDLKLDKKYRRSAKNYYIHLQSLGYTGQYDSIRRYTKKYLDSHTSQVKGAFIPLSFEPGEAYQFDWSTEQVELGREDMMIKLAHFRLSYSRMFFLIAYVRESQEMLFDAHDKAFEFYGGVPRRGIYDNMKTAVDKVFISKSERKFNQYFLCLMKHYIIEPTACNPASGWEKGQVENQVDNIRDWIFKPKAKFDSLAELNEYLYNKAIELSKTRKHPQQKDKTIYEVFQEEKKCLNSFNTSFKGYKEETRYVSNLCLIKYDSNAYSVDCLYANKQVDVHIYPDTIEVFADTKLVAKHSRSFAKHRRILNPFHYLNILDRKPGALRNGEPFKGWDLPESILKVKDTLMSRKHGDREAVNVLLALRDYGIEAVEVACDLAISNNVITAQSIINSVTRLNCQESNISIDISESLKLNDPPSSDCSHYDNLLGANYE